MKIGLCYDTREAQGYSNVNMYCCNYPAQKTVDAIANLITQSGFEVCFLGSTKELLNSLEITEFDLAFPMLCSSNGRGRQIWLPSTLELYNIPFIGSDARSILLSSDKYQSGLVAKTFGVPSIPSVVLFDSSGNKQAIDKFLCFPGIVKPNYESDSKGVFLVQNEKEMWYRAEEDWNIYKGKILFQPYLSGSEITVSLYESNGKPVVFGMAETIDSDDKPLKVYSYEQKHLHHSLKRHPNISSNSYEIISQYAKTMFEVLECHDYARMDFRMDAAGTPHLLEATLTPSLPLSASFFMGGILNGITPSTIMRYIVASAAQRYGLYL